MNSYLYHIKHYPSFLIGIARILDITGSLSPHKRWYKYNSEFEDSKAIYSDWKSVGDSLREALGGIHLSSK